MKRTLPLAGLLAVSASALAAQDYYLVKNQDSWIPDLWEQVNHSDGWHTHPSETGTGYRLTSFDTNGHYHNNGFRIFTRDTADTFDGASLTLNGGFLELRATDGTPTSYLSTVHNLIIGPTGTAIGTNDWAGGGVNGGGLNVTTLTVNGNLRLERDGPRHVRINVTTVVGSANIEAGTTVNSRVGIGISNATGYTGNIVANAGTLSFTSDISSSGGLDILTGATIFTSGQSLSFTSVTIGGTALAEGTYDIAALDVDALYGKFFVNGSTGTLIIASAIPEPSAVAALAGAFALGCAALRRRARR